nr:unnamed protein product [Digitaria exilis]
MGRDPHGAATGGATCGAATGSCSARRGDGRHDPWHGGWASGAQLLAAIGPAGGLFDGESTSPACC